MAILWLGSTDLTQTPDSPEKVYGQTNQFVYHYEGPYATCEAAVPAYGSTHVASGLPVIQARTSKQEGGKGRLSITVETPDFLPSGGGTRVTETYEIDWVTIEKPLEDHPRYASGGASELTAQDRVDVQLWQAQADFAASENKPLYKYNKYTSFSFGEGSSWTTITLSANAQHLATRLLKGQTTYRASQPVARISSLHDSEPSTAPCNTYRTTKPFTACPSDFVWLKTTDRATRTGRSGRWVRNIEYMGIKDLDTALYTAE